MRIKEVNILYTGILVLAAALAWSFVSHRPMLSEGAQWYFQIIHLKDFFTDHRLIRYFDYVIQGPGVLFLKVFGEAAYDASNQAAIWLLSFGWTMYVLISLLISALILKRHKREDLLAFQIIGTLAAYMPASGYAVALAMPAMYCFWPLFYFLLFADGFKRSDFVWFSLMAFILAICYEATVIFFGLISFLALLDLFVVKKRNRKFNGFIILFSIVASIILVRSILIQPKQITGPFWSSLFANQIDHFRIFGFCIVAVTLPIPFFIKFKSKAQLFFTAVSSLLFGFVVFKYGLLIFAAWQTSWPAESPFLLDDAYAARSTALPVMAGVAFGCYLLKNLTADAGWLHSYVGRFFAVAIFVFAVMVSMIDVSLTNEWRADFSRFEKYVLEVKGCVNLDGQEYERQDWSPSIQYFGLPYSTVMLQILKFQTPVTKLLFTNKPLADQPASNRNACVEQTNHFYFSNQGFYLDLGNGRIKAAIENAK